MNEDDRDRAEALMVAVLGHVKDFYEVNEPCRDNILVVLNALGCAVATVLVGTNMDPQMVSFFEETVRQQANLQLAADECSGHA
jgi:hypothetical protein